MQLKILLYLKGHLKHHLYFVHFSSNLDRIWLSRCPKNGLGNCEFCENPQSGSQNLLTGVN